MREIFSEKLLILGLLLAVGLSIYTHSMVFREWTMPTYGNTFIHVASVRHTIEYGAYPMIDYSYGGGVPNLYVPFYRLFIANAVLLTGLSIDFVSRMAVMLFAVFFPLAMFSLGKRLFGVEAGVFAAFFASLPGELLIYTVRPLPQALGMVLLPVAFLALFSEKTKAALFMAFAVSMVHQEAAVFFAGASFGYFLLVQFFKEKKGAQLAFYCFIVATATYLLWHYWVMHSFNVFELAQFKNHEGGMVSMDSYLTKTGIVVAALSLVGLLFVLRGMLRDFLQQFPVNEDLQALAEQAVLLAFAAASVFFYLNGFSFQYQAAEAPLKDLHSALGFIPPAFQTAGISVLFGIVVALFATFTASKTKISSIGAYSHLFAFAVFFTGFFATKNDAVGIRVFMDRFLVYLQEPLVLLAALGCASLLAFFRQFGKWS